MFKLKALKDTVVGVSFCGEGNLKLSTSEHFINSSSPEHCRQRCARVERHFVSSSLSNWMNSLVIYLGEKNLLYSSSS